MYIREAMPYASWQRDMTARQDKVGRSRLHEKEVRQKRTLMLKIPAVFAGLLALCWKLRLWSVNDRPAESTRIRAINVVIDMEISRVYEASNVSSDYNQ